MLIVGNGKGLPGWAETAPPHGSSTRRLPMRATLWACVLLVGSLAPASAAALTTTYADESLFLADLPGPPITLDLESLAPGTLLPSGSTLGDWSYPASVDN